MHMETKKNVLGSETVQYLAIEAADISLLNKKVEIALGKGWVLRGDVVCFGYDGIPIYVQAVTRPGGTVEEVSQLKGDFEVEEERASLVNDRLYADLYRFKKRMLACALVVLLAVFFLCYKLARVWS